MITLKVKPSWSIRAAKLFAPGSEIVLIRFADDFESVEIVHDNRMSSRALLEAAQMALARVIGRVS